MRKLVLFMLMVAVISTLGFLSCKKSKTAGMAADTTSALQTGVESAQVQTTPPLAGTARVDTADTTRRSATDTSQAAAHAGKRDTTSKAMSGPATGDRGFGPVKKVKLGPIDDKLVAQGSQIFNSKCTACHQLDTKKIGPPLRNVTKQQTPEFIMNMILNSDEMEKKDAHVKDMIKQTGTYMSPQGLTQVQARSVLEYLRSVAPK